MNTFALSVFASDHIFFQGNAVSLTLPATDGLYGIQANHRNLIGAVIPGKLTFTLVLYTFTYPQYLLITSNLSTINNYILFFNSSITVCN